MNPCIPASIPAAEEGFYFQWHFLESCNLRCIHCYQQGYATKELPREQIFQIALHLDNALSKWGKRGRISLTGGEPFLRKDLLCDLLERFNSSEHFNWIGILTNGTLIDDSIVDRLQAYDKLKEIQVSIDGATEMSHDKVRGSGSYARALEGIARLKVKGFTVSLMFTLHRLNQDEAEGVIDLAQQLGVDALTIERVTPMNDDDRQRLFIEVETLQAIYKRIYRKKLEAEKTSKLKIRVSRPLWNLIDEHIGGFCPVGLSSLCILHDGTALPCRRMEIPLGNVLTDGLFKIWYTSQTLWKLRNKHLLQGKCHGCPTLGNCGGCRAIAYTINGDVMAEDPQCWR